MCFLTRKTDRVLNLYWNGDSGPPGPSYSHLVSTKKSVELMYAVLSQLTPYFLHVPQGAKYLSEAMMEIYGKDAFAFIIDEGGEISAPVFI